MSYFADKLRRKSQEIDQQYAPKSRYDIEPLIVPDVPVTTKELFNVHRRTLPVGGDRIVLWNLTKKEFDDMKLNRLDHDLMKDLTGQCRTHVENDNTIVYYDLVPVNATEEEKSVYFNEKVLTVDSIDMKVEQIPLVEFIG